MASQPRHASLIAYDLPNATPSSPQGSQGHQAHKGRACIVDLTAEDSILYADPTIVAAVTDSLLTTLEALTSEGVSSAIDPRLPAGGFPSDPPSYEPVTHLINKVIDTAKPYIPQSHLGGLRFHPFGREVNGVYRGHKRLKPDGVGIIGGLPTETKEPAEEPARAEKPVLSWEQVVVVFESKGTVKDMVQQSAIYARCCLLRNRRRLISLGIGFQFRKLEAFFVVFHRRGILSSSPLKVTTSEGFKGLVNHLVGLLSLKDEAAYGTCFEKYFHISRRYFEISRPRYALDSLQGLDQRRCVHAYSECRTSFIYRIPSRQYYIKSWIMSEIDSLPGKITYK